MRALNRKLWRDLWRMRGQAVAIALVIGSGVGLMVQSLSAFDSLSTSTDAYYERYAFADIFARATRAPNRLERRIAALEGVRAVETRITGQGLLEIDGFEETAVGLISSIPEDAQPALNRLALRAGRLLSPNRPDEAIVSEPFALAHGLEPGDAITATIYGVRRRLSIVGVALSPEYVYALGPGALMPDDARYAVIWMSRSALEAAFDRKGAFNSVAVALTPGFDPETVADAIDALLVPYGGQDAVLRKDQISNWFLMNELSQLERMATILPTIFLGVAAFLTQMVVGRLIATERSQIGLLKAFGYSNAAIAWHYAKTVLLLAISGVLIGCLVGSWLGWVVTGIYAEQYKLPLLLFRPSAASFAIAGGASVVAALLGAASAINAAMRLPPAEAIRPPAPPDFSRGARLGERLRLDQATRVILRTTLRWPVRAAVTAIGVGMSVAVLITAFHWMDSIDRMVDLTFTAEQRHDATVTLAEPRPRWSVGDFMRLPGVLAVEGERSAAVRFFAGANEKRGGLTGREQVLRLSPIIESSGQAAPPVTSAITMSSMLARILEVEVGDAVSVEFLDGRRPTVEMRIGDVFETDMGLPAYVELETLSRIRGRTPTVDTVRLRVDDARLAEFHAALREIPNVASISMRRAALDMFNDTLGETILIFIGFFTAFASALAIGVVYNSIRIALSERERELATLRVLGYRRWEIAYVLLGQSALLTVVALPLGCLAGVALAALITETMATELFRVPLVIDPSTFGVAMLIALAASAVSAALVRRRLARLDLIAVLKTRE